jgi:sporulation protein YlmC with PRC-barrel domain
MARHVLPGVDDAPLPAHVLVMRDIVDNQILDVQGERVTKVAGIEAEASDDGSEPVVRNLLIGPEPLARRVGERTAACVRWLTRGRRTVRIPLSDVTAVGPDVRLRTKASATGGTHAEDWVRDHIARFIPSIK